MYDLKTNPTLADIQKHIDDFCRLKGFDKKNDYEVFLLFTEEVGELAKAIRYEKKLAEERIPDNHSLEHEFADVLNYLMDLANRFNINLEDAYRGKYSFNKNRSWK